MRLRYRRMAIAWIAGIALSITPGSLAIPAQFSPWAQLGLPQISRSDNANSTTAADIATGEVRLDGRRLFAIAAPAVPEQNRQQGSNPPIQQRTNEIESALERVVNSNFDPKNLQVTVSVDANSNLPVIAVNGQYLMTVTTLDAQLGGRDPARQAAVLSTIVRNGLLTAHRERQTDYLVKQGLLAAGVGLGVLLSSLGLMRFQRRLRVQSESAQEDAPPPPEPGEEVADLSQRAEVILANLQWRFAQRRQRDLRELQRRLLQAIQAALWGLGVFTILGLFPYTREFQPLVLSTPLRVLGIGLGTYLIIRVSHVLIDRLMGIVQGEALLAPEVSRRLSLRFSTFSTVTKGVAAVLGISIGGLAILSLIGIEIVPVLAGAGIIGIGISLASQNLIKDIINGFFILLEDQYAVGDVITIGTATGLVENMNLRVTQLRNAEGRLITIPNSSISIVENLSKEWSRVDLLVQLPYDTDLKDVTETIQQVGQDMMQEAEWQAQMLELPDILGVEEVSDKDVTLRLWIKTQPLEQWSVDREFRRRLKLALDAKEILVKLPKATVSFKSPPVSYHKKRLEF